MVATEKGDWELTRNGQEGTFGVNGNILNLDGMWVLCIYALVETYQTIHFKAVYITVYKLYFNF